MSSTGTGYDLESSTFSPDGRLYQVEYAIKCCDNSETALGLRGTDGVVIAIDRPVLSQMALSSSNQRVFTPAENVAFGATGLYPDSKALAKYCSEQSQEYFLKYREHMPADRLLQQLSEYVHAHTVYAGLRPFGCSAFLGFYNSTDGGRLYMVDSSGYSLEYHAWAQGKARQAAKAELEKLKLDKLSCMQLVKEAARILLMVRDHAKDKNVVVDMVWVGKHTGGKSEIVPAEILAEAEEYAKRTEIVENAPDSTPEGAGGNVS